jgi:hypothetical protein
VAAGRVDAAEALAPNKLVEVNITSDGRGRQCRDIAIVDAVVTHDRTVGARALWKPQSLAAAYLAFAEPGAIGLSSIGGCCSRWAGASAAAWRCRSPTTAPRR